MLKKKSKILIAILTLLICLSAFNIQSFATELDMEDVYEITESVTDSEESVYAESSYTEENTAQDVSVDDSVLNTDEEDVAKYAAEAPVITPVEFPKISISYSYFNEATEITSTSSFLASYNVAETIQVKANSYPDKVKINENDYTVTVNGETDITSEVGYDTETGIMNIPIQYNKTNVGIEFKLPETEITEVEVNGKFVVTDPYGVDTLIDESCICASNSSEIRFPIETSDEYDFTVSALQGDIDLDGRVRLENGQIVIETSPMGGNISGHLHSDYIGKRISGRRVAARTASSWEELGWAATVSNNRVPNAYDYGKYGSHITSSFSANGNTAYCIQPSISGPPAGTYDVSGYLAFLPDENFSVNGYGGKETVNKLVYYGLGGPAYDASMYGGDSGSEQYVITHIALSLLCSGTTEGLYKTNGNALPAAQALIANANAKPAPPDDFQVFLYNVGGEKQGCLSWIMQPLKKNGRLEIKKVSANPSVTTNNSGYSLAGAQFAIYDKSDNTLIDTITTDENGNAVKEELPQGEYLVKEVKAPTGYKIGSQAAQGFDVSITADQTSTLEVSDEPLRDPVVTFIVKGDKDGNPVPQGKADLSGAQFTVKYYAGIYSKDEVAGITPTRTWILETKPVSVSGKTVYMAMLSDKYFVSGSSFYYDLNGTDPIVPLGTLTVQETQAPTGYLIDTELYHFNIKPDNKNIGSVVSVNLPEIVDEIIRGGVRVEKWDSELNEKQAQGGATLKGAEFEIVSKSNNSVKVGGKTYNKNEAVTTITVDENGVATTTADLLPYGDYEIRESKAPAGYEHSGTLTRSFSIRKNGVIVNLNTSDTAIKNDVIRGGVRVEKWDNELNERTRQGDTTLEGAVFEIISKNSNPVLVDGKRYAKDEVVATITTNKDGIASTSSTLLPYGEYEIYEKTPPQGYRHKGVLRRTFRIEKQGVIVNLNDADTSIKNDVIRGGIRIEKWDNEIDENTAQGGATLKNAEFEIVNRSKTSVLVEDKLYTNGEVVYTLLTDETGAYETSNNLLPYGTYEIRETKAPEGYLHTGVLSRTFEIRENGVIVNLNTTDTAIKNNPIRGDLKGVKIADGDAGRLANVPFTITSLTTGESHTVVTDRNGMFNTSSEWNPHSDNTNRGEKCTDGVWFGKIETLNDNFGALLYDDYLVEEQPCEANKDKELLSVKVSIYRHNTVINLGTLTDDYISQPEIGTTAIDAETMSNEAFTNSQTVISDTVYYSGLQAGKTYTVKGIIMDKQSEMPLVQNGNNVTAETTFRALSSEGTVVLDFTFNTEDLDGKSIVVFESLYLDDTKTAVHEDISDDNQTIEFTKPEIRTKATGSEGEKEIGIGKEITVIDTVEYKGLIPNETYSVTGTLMDKDTQKPVINGGKEVTSETTFKPDKADGVVTLAFVFNNVELTEKEIVAFETLEYKGRELAVHSDIEDKDQTVKVKKPEIETQASNINGNKELDVSREVEIIDTIQYSGLTQGETYTVKGVLMDKETSKPIMQNGKSVEAEASFIAEAENGQISVSFKVDTITLIGKDLVVFEKLYCADSEIASHENISDEEQTVQVKNPEIGTKATGANGEQTIDLKNEVQVIDTVSFKNLSIGETYTVKGILMDKETAEPLVIDGKNIEAEAEFTPQTENGEIQVIFTLNSTSIAGKEIVVFEKLHCSESEIAAHEEISDEGQTVKVKNPEIGTQATGQDGEKEILRSEETVIKDTVSYSGLSAGETYTLKGILMNKDTNEAIMIDDEPITAEAEFTPETTDGSIEVIFTFNAENIETYNIVVFESLYYAETKIAAHQDITDESQTVVFIDHTNIITSAKRPKTGDDTNLIPYLIMTAVSGIAMAVICVRAHKKKKQDGDKN